MRMPSAELLLAIWDTGAHTSAMERALTLLAHAWPDDRAPADWRLGQRNARLLALRTELLGDRIEATAACPRCDERIDLQLSSTTIAAADRPPDPDAPDPPVRPPTSRDLAVALALADRAAARRLVLQRCAGEPDARELADDELEARMAADDPLAEILIDGECPACLGPLCTPLDVPGFFAIELAAHAQRLLHEVHTLASTYHWSEAEILQLSSRRRRFYLEQVYA